jgi:hypothetical protein
MKNPIELTELEEDRGLPALAPPPGERVSFNRPLIMFVLKVRTYDFLGSPPIARLRVQQEFLKIPRTNCN